MKSVAITYLLCYGGALCAIFSPWIGLLAYIAFAVLAPHLIWKWTVPQYNYSLIVALALLLGWVLQNTGNWSFGRAKPIVYTLIGFLAWMGLATLFSGNSTGSYFFLDNQFKIVLPFVVGMTLVDSVDKLKQLTWVMVISLAVWAYELNSSYFFVDQSHLFFNGFGVLDNNGVAVAMVTGAGIAFMLGMEEQAAWRRWIAFVFALMMIHVIMFSHSRGGMLAGMVMGAAMFTLVIIRPHRVRNLTYFSIALVLAGILTGPSVVERFSTIWVEEKDRDASAQGRTKLWADATDLMMRNPVFGVGPNMWPQHADQYGWPPGKASHTTWLNAGAETGVMGMALFLGFFLLTIWRCFVLLWRCWRDPAVLAQVDPFCQSACAMTVAALVGFVIAAQFVSLQMMELPYYIALLGAGALKISSAALNAPLPAPRPSCHLAPTGKPLGGPPVAGRAHLKRNFL